MKSLCVKMLWRFWLGWATLAVVIFVLSSIMEPRPRKIEDMFFPLGKKDFSPSFTLRSNDGRYLAVIGSFPYSWKKLFLLDTIARQELFSIAGDFGDVIFDSANALLFCHHFDSNNGAVPIHEQLIRWNPEAKTQEVLHSFQLPASKYFEFELRGGSLQYPWKEKPWIWGRWSILSPDARYWVVPCFDDQHHWHEQIDLATGKSMGRLQLADMQNDQSHDKVCEMSFIEDASILLLKTRHFIDRKEHFRLHWLEAGTGKLLGTMPIPSDISECLFADNKLLVAKATQESYGSTARQKVFVINWRDKALKPIELNEIRPDLQERPDYVPAAYVTPGATIQCNVDPASQKLIVSWSYEFCQKVGHFRGTIQFGSNFQLPDIHYSIRDLNTGEVVHLGIVPFPNNSDKTGWKRDFIYLKTVLPGPVLVCYRAKQNPEGTFEKWLDWVQQKLSLERTTINETIYFVDGMSGQVQTTIRQISGLNDITLSVDQKTLSITTTNHYRYLYDYPLHKPWLLICAWAIGVAGGISVLAETGKWWRRRKLVSTPARHAVAPSQ